MIPLKRTAVLLTAVFAVSALSSAATCYLMKRRTAPESSWSRILKLTPEQEKEFNALESDVQSTLNDIEKGDAENKIFFCSYLDSADRSPEALNAATARMAETYRLKQDKIARSLVAITSILDPEQKKTFAHTLMKEVCESCRNATESDKCLCGMCGGKS